MKILLVQAYLGTQEPPIFPLGLSYLAAAVKGHNVKVFDPNVVENPPSEFTNILLGFRPEIVGISLRNIDSTNKRKVVFYYRFFKEMISLVEKYLNGHCRLVVGGPGFSMFANEIMRDVPAIEYGVFVEAENAFRELIENLDQPEKVKGIFYRKNRKVMFTGPREHSDLDTLMPPDRTIISMAPYINIPDAIGVETKRGCIFSCSYCVYGFLNGKKYRLINPVRVVDDIEFLYDELGIRHFMFIDSVFNNPLPHAEAICREIIRRSIDVRWSAWFHEKFMTEEFIRIAKEAGCNKVMLSPDGIDPDTLRGLGKSQAKQDILRCFNMLKSDIGKIEVYYNFFKNPPKQNLVGFLSLLRFYVRAKFQLKSRVHFEFNSLRIEPHTELCEMALKEGLIDVNDPLLYPKYYTNTDTWYIDKAFNVWLRVKESLS